MMDILRGSPMRGRKLDRVKTLLALSGLDYDEGVEFTVLLADGNGDSGEDVATASRQGNVLKCIAVSPARQGEGVAAVLLTELLKNAFEAGLRHLFLYTKPDRKRMFSDLSFHTVAETGDVLFMENVRDGVRKFVAGLMEEGDAPPDAPGAVGAVVMNANPFTNGHLRLVRHAAGECGLVHVFVLSEDKSEFPAADRIRLVREGTAGIPNVRVHPTGDYLISAATFPSYFIKDKATAGAINHELDLAVFAQCFAPPMRITKRFVGEEPFCPVTRSYNEAMRAYLPAHGVDVVVLPRYEIDGEAVSASRVRKLAAEGGWDAVRRLVPETTYRHLRDPGTTPHE